MIILETLYSTQVGVNYIFLDDTTIIFQESLENRRTLASFTLITYRPTFKTMENRKFENLRCLFSPIVEKPVA